MSLSPATPTGYAALLSEIRQRVRHAQTRAWAAANAELIRLYWEIGAMIATRQQQAGWGAGVIPRLARDLRDELPEEKGFSERNIKQMLAFYREYPHLSLMQQGVAQSAEAKKVQQVVALFSPELMLAIPWGHHGVLMAKVKSHEARLWYMQATLENGWSREALLAQIQSNTYARIEAVASNFSLRLPAPDSELAKQSLKDPYLFDFLTLEADFHERELEAGLIAHLEKFLLELGQGFACVGRQYPLEVDGQDFYLDLLFYHLTLRCYVVIELKRGAFKPEYAGKINFYCNVVNDRLRHADDKPTIGLILCQEHHRVLAEYALRGMDKPIGVSSYELTRALPENLKSSLPSIETIEQELGDSGVTP